MVRRRARRGLPRRDTSRACAQRSAGGKSRIITTDPGYQMVIVDGELDLHVFRGLRAEAEAEARAGDWKAAARTLHSALRLWRDAPLLDVSSGLLQQDEVPILTETRLHVLELRVEADLRVGGRHSVIAVPTLARPWPCPC
jgi:hypothetical protein